MSTLPSIAKHRFNLDCDEIYIQSTNHDGIDFKFDTNGAVFHVPSGDIQTDGAIITNTQKSTDGTTISTIEDDGKYKIHKDVKFDSSQSIDFNNCSMSNVGGLNGELSTANIVSLNGYATADLELDNITSTQNTVKNRTENLTVNRMMISNNAGLLASGDFAQTKILRNDLTTQQAVVGDINLASGKRIKYDGVALELSSSSKLNTDLSNIGSAVVPEANIHSSITRDNEVNTATQDDLDLKLNLNLSNLGNAVIPEANIHASITRDNEVSNAVIGELSGKMNNDFSNINSGSTLPEANTHADIARLANPTFSGTVKVPTILSGTGQFLRVNGSTGALEKATPTDTDTNTQYDNTDFVDLSSNQTIAGIKNYTNTSNFFSGFNSLGTANVNLNRDSVINTQQVFNNAYVSGTTVEYCVKRGCSFKDSTETFAGAKVFNNTTATRFVNGLSIGDGTTDPSIVNASDAVSVNTFSSGGASREVFNVGQSTVTVGNSDTVNMLVKGSGDVFQGSAVTGSGLFARVGTLESTSANASALLDPAGNTRVSVLNSGVNFKNSSGTTRGGYNEATVPSFFFDSSNFNVFSPSGTTIFGMNASNTTDANISADMRCGVHIHETLRVDGNATMNGDVEVDSAKDFKKEGVAYGVYEQLAALTQTIADLTPSPWLSVADAGGSYSSGFQSHTTTGSGSGVSEVQVRYQKYIPKAGFVYYHIHMKGNVRKSNNSAMVSSSNMFILPSLYRPQKAVYVLANTDASSSAYHSSSAHIMISSTGYVQMRRKALSADPDGTDPQVDVVNLDLVHYYTDNDSNETW